MSDDERAIRELSDAQGAAIIAGDVETLDRLLGVSFTATHITGYVQPKAEWLADITSGQMQYHSTEEILWDLTIDGDTATIESRTRVDATIYGSRRVWNLTGTADLAKVDGEWKVMRSVAGTF